MRQIVLKNIVYTINDVSRYALARSICVATRSTLCARTCCMIVDHCAGKCSHIVLPENQHEESQYDVCPAGIVASAFLVNKCLPGLFFHRRDAKQNCFVRLAIAIAASAGIGNHM